MVNCGRSLRRAPDDDACSVRDRSCGHQWRGGPRSTRLVPSRWHVHVINWTASRPPCETKSVSPPGST